MGKEPILAARTIKEGRLTMLFQVEGGLHYIKGNTKPYFTLTYTLHRKGFPSQIESCGAGPDEILKHYPQFADLAALHLSDIDGVPMHAEANGWFWLAGALGGAGERFHGGTGKGQFGGEYREPTEAECLEVFAKHCRITVEEAEAIKADVSAHPDMRARWADIMSTMYPRWRTEAEACIKNHNLRIYGDQWSAQSEAV